MSATNPIPFLDLVGLHADLKEELCAVFASALDSAAFIGGPMVQGFETDFAAFCQTEHCVGVSSGTDAVRFALIAAGVRPGDTVVTVPNTFIATTEAISQAGARPAFVDIDERTYNLDAAKMREYLIGACRVDAATGVPIDLRTQTPVTAVVPVHLYGQMADMDPILDLAEEFHLIVIEDACQAHGAEYFSKRANRWYKAGSMGRAAAFSFYPGKNLGACGEGGAVTTSDAALAAKVRMLRDHGQSRKYYHEIEGYNGRLDAIQAGILRVKLRHLAEWNEQRRAAASRYNELLGSAEGYLIAPWEPEWSKAIYHLYVIRLQNRDDAIKRLSEVGIGTGIHYPVPLHLQEAYLGLGFRANDFPVAETVCREIVSLPMFPTLGKHEEAHIADIILHYVAQGFRLVGAH